MNKYKLFGLVIESDIKFPQLLPAEDLSTVSESDIVVVHNGDISGKVNGILEGGAVNYCVGLTYSCFRNSYGYYIIEGTNEIIYEAKQGIRIEDIQAFILGYCIAMLLLHRKTLAIHCSAVCDMGSADEGAILIAGNSGAGKSSLTRKLIEEGYKVMTDDIAAVNVLSDEYGNNTAIVYPAFPYQKLCRNEVEKRNMDLNELIYVDEDKDKFLVPLKDIFVDRPLKLKGMLFLNVSDVNDVQVTRLSGLSQLMAVRQNLFLRKFYGDWQNDPQILNLSLKIAANCPVYLINRPAEGDTLSAISDQVKELFD